MSTTLSSPLHIYRVYRVGKRPKGAIVGMVVAAIGWAHARELASLATTGTSNSPLWCAGRGAETEYLGTTPRGDKPRVIMTEYAR